jgi:hypothetical protein
LNRLAILVSLALVFSHADQGFAACMPREVAKNDPYQYTLTLVATFGYASSGRGRSTTDPSKAVPEERLSAVKKMMVELKLAIQDYECAASLVNPYMDSEDEAIRISARGANTAYVTLAMVDAKTVTDFRLLLDGESPQTGVGSRLEAVANDEVLIDETWKLLPAASVAVLHALVGIGAKEDEPITHLRISGSQRQTILRALKDLFPTTELERGMQAGQLPLELAAAALYHFVADAKWRSAGE